MEKRNLSTQIAQRNDLADAAQATKQEHDLKFFQAIRLYARAVLWSVIISSALIMEGYDTKLVGALYAQPAFTKAYGKVQPDGSHQIPAIWQASLTTGSNISQMLGLVIGGNMTERHGSRRTMMAALLAIPWIIFFQVFASNLQTLELGQCLLGVPLGMFQTVTLVYAVEVMPVCLRAHLAAYAAACWVLGKFIATVVLRILLNVTGALAYRLPFALQWIWPLPLLAGAYLSPESPWWLVRNYRYEEAKASVRALTSPQIAEADVDRCVTLMTMTVDHERRTNDHTGYLSCFEGINLRRTLIVMGCYCLQVLTGSNLKAYITYFFEQAGLSAPEAFDMTIVAYGLGIFGVIMAWVLLPHVNRRTLLLYGISMIGTLFLLIGRLGIALANSPKTSPALSWAIANLLPVALFIFDVTVGPVTYALVGELRSSLLRSKSVVIARFSYAIINLIGNTITPHQLNPSAWAWGARSGLFWAVTCVIAWLFTYFCVPEPSGRTTAELDLLFEQGISARNFEKTKINVLDIGIEKHA